MGAYCQAYSFAIAVKGGKHHGSWHYSGSYNCISDNYSRTDRASKQETEAASLRKRASTRREIGPRFAIVGKNWAPENNVVTNTNLSQREAAERTGLSKRQQALAWLAVAMWLGSFVIMFNVSSGFGLLVFVASYGVGYLATRGMTWRDALGMGDPREG
jgi:hypothetical protein